MIETIKKVLPFLGTTLAGPLGGIAATFIADKLGLPEKTVEAVTSALSGLPPDKLVEMKASELEFQKFMAELGFKQVRDLEALALENVKDARAREVQTGDPTTKELAKAYTIGYFAILLVSIFVDFPDGNREVLLALMGILSAAQIAIIQYYFGSSKGSADKNEALQVALRNVEKRRLEGSSE